MEVYAYRNANPPADTVVVVFNRPGKKPMEFATVILSTEKVKGQAVVPSAYPKAERSQFATDGPPGFSLDDNNRGFNTVAGESAAKAATFDFSGEKPKVVSFAATFDIRGDASKLVGHVYANFDPDAPPPPKMPEPAAPILPSCPQIIPTCPVCPVWVEPCRRPRLLGWRAGRR